MDGLETPAERRRGKRSVLSLAEPENEIVSPTRQVSWGEGVAIVGKGGVSPGVIVTFAVLSALNGSEKRIDTRC